MKNKRGALELSVGTIVVIVIAMSMLILGLVLVRTIFTSSIYNVNQLNDKVQGEIQKLFAEEGKSVVYLSEGKAEVKQGEDWGVAFAYRNTQRDTTNDLTLKYTVSASPDVTSSCRGLTQTEANSWIRARGTGSVTLPPGDISYNIIRFTIPEDAPLCIVPYDIKIEKTDGDVYTNNFFDLVVQ
jgi:hypothetical protein